MAYIYKGTQREVAAPKVVKKKPRKKVVQRNHNRVILNDSVPPLQPCGTSAAYQRHKRAGEEVCIPCLNADRERHKIKRRKVREERGGRVWEES